MADKGQPCPYCETPLVRTRPMDRRRLAGPDPGDWSVCTSCGGLLVFLTPNRVRKPLPGEWTALLGEDYRLAEQLQDRQRAIRQRLGEEVRRL